MLTEGVVAGGIVAVMMALIKVIDKMVDRKNGGAFKETIRTISAILAKTDEHGSPLIYGAAQLNETIRRQTDILAQMERHFASQVTINDRRIAVCESHTELLKKIGDRL